MTFSICAFDRLTGQLGVAVATAHLAVGALVPHAQANVCCVATQAATNPLLGLSLIETCLKTKEGHLSLKDNLREVLLSDPNPSIRQIHGVAKSGEAVAWTGKECLGWAGHITGHSLSVAGNMLTGSSVLVAMKETFQVVPETVPLAERLLYALEAGEAAGGDKRGKQSASLLVVSEEDYPELDLRVDDSLTPLGELRRLYLESCKDYYRSFRAETPTSVTMVSIAERDDMVHLDRLGDLSHVNSPRVAPVDDEGTKATSCLWTNTRTEAKVAGQLLRGR